MFKRLLTLTLALTVATIAMAFNFTGKTFKGTATNDNGSSITITAKFRANNRLTMSYSGKGIKPETDSGMMWEISGDFINIYDSTGDYSYFAIDWDEDGVCLSMCDANGYPYVTLHEVKTTTTAPAAKSSKSGKRRR